MVGVLGEEDFAGVGVLNEESPIALADIGRGEDSRDAIAKERDVRAGRRAIRGTALGRILGCQPHRKWYGEGAQHEGRCKKCGMKIFARHEISKAVLASLLDASKLSFSKGRVKRERGGVIDV
jgi:hypothetical protein